ncbi:MAG: glycosyltransferase, partial [Gaiellaceae bacterium MAG52_C11]|nr:glycosyltransferase [Candidatus Gaiellasilicea maunaloa]
VVVEEPADANAACARNLGARRATGDVLVFVDSDVEVRADAVSRIRAAFAGDPTLTALFGSYDDSPAAPGVVSAFRNLLHHHVHQTAPGPATTFWTGLGAVRRDAFEAIGGFDESVAMMEDIDLGMRLSANGARIELDAAVQGTHLKSWSVWGMVRADFADRGVPWVMLLLRHRGSTTALNLGWRHRLSALAALFGAIAVVRRRPSAAIVSGLGLVALNHSFYRLLLRRRGLVEATAGVLLHALHHLASIAAVPVGVFRHLRGGRRRGR